MSSDKRSTASRFKTLADPGLLVMLLLATLAAWPLITRASLATGTDAQNHVYRVYEILAAWREGILYPRWAPDFYYGFGYPVFDYYSTLSYYLAAAYGWFWGAVAGVKFVFVLSTYLGIAGVYLFARDEWGPAPAIASAALFGFAPYIVLVEPIQRGGLPEELAVALAPWLLWSFTRLARTGSRAFWFVSTLTLAAIVVAHNLMSFVFIGLLAAWLAWRMLLIERPASRAAFARTLARLGTAALAAAALTAYMWLPAAAERGAVQFQNAFALVQARRFLSFGMLFAPATAHDAQTVDIALYQFRLGWPQWMLGALGALALLRPSPQRRATLFWVLVTLPCLFVMDPVSNWFWQHLNVLPYLQFSYRLLAVTALSLALVAGALVNTLASTQLPLGRNGWAVLLVAITIIGGLPLLNPAPWPEFGSVDPKAMLNLDLFKSRGVGTTGEGEFLPVTVQTEPVPAQPVVDAILAGGREKVDRAALPAGATIDETAHELAAQYLPGQRRGAVYPAPVHVLLGGLDGVRGRPAHANHRFRAARIYLGTHAGRPALAHRAARRHPAAPPGLGDQYRGVAGAAGGWLGPGCAPLATCYQRQPAAGRVVRAAAGPAAGWRCRHWAGGARRARRGGPLAGSAHDPQHSPGTGAALHPL